MEAVNHFLAINYTLDIGGQMLQGNMIYPTTLDNFQDDIDSFELKYPLARIAFYTLSSVPDPATGPAVQYPLNRHKS